MYFAERKYMTGLLEGARAGVNFVSGRERVESGAIKCSD